MVGQNRPLVGELALASDRFRLLWARHDVQAREGASVTLDHPHVGELILNREKLTAGGSAGQLLVVCHADPGSDTAEKVSAVPLPGSRANSGIGQLPEFWPRSTVQS